MKAKRGEVLQAKPGRRDQRPLRRLETLGRDRISSTFVASDGRNRRFIVREFPTALAPGFHAQLPFLFRLQRRLSVPRLVRPLSLLQEADRSLWIHAPVAGEALSHTEFGARGAARYVAHVLRLMSDLHAASLVGLELTPERLFVDAEGLPLSSGLIASPELWSASGGPASLFLAQVDASVDLGSLGRVIRAVLDRTRTRSSAEARLIESLARQAQTLESTAGDPWLGVEGLAEILETLAASPVRRRAVPQAPVPRLVGRDLVLREIQALIERALHGGGGRRAVLVAVAGRAGVGKTRVVTVLARRLQARGLEVLAAAAQEGDRRPLGPLEEILAAAGVTVGEPAAGEAEERTPLHPSAERRRHIETAIRLLQQALGERSAVLIVEDVDLLPAAAMDVLSYLVRDVALEEPGAARLAVVLTLRPGDDPETPSAAAALVDELREEGFSERVRLPPLDREAVAEMLGSLGIEDPREAERLFARSGGNPRLVEELVRLEREQGGREAAGSALGEIFRRRLKQLEPCERRLLDAAAIVGGPAPLGLLEAMVPTRERSRLYGTVMRLLGRRILCPVAGPAYDFVNRDAARWVRERISRRQARELHRLAGRALEAGPAAADPGVLARHYELGGVRSRFLAYGRQAADELESAHANERALELYDKLLALVPERQKGLRIELLERSAALRSLVGNFAAAAAAYRQLLDSPHDPARTWQYWRALGEACRDREDYAAAAEAFDRGLAILGPGEDLAVADLLSEKAHIQARMGDVDTARGLAEMAGNIAASLPESREVAAVRNRVGATFHRLGDNERAVQHIEAALGLSERVGALDLAAIALNNLGLYLLKGGQLGRAIELCQRSLEIQEKLGDVEAAATTAVNLAHLYLHGYEPEKASQCVEKSLSLAGRFGRSFIIAAAQNNLAEAHILRGRYGDALECRKRALSIAERLGRTKEHAALLLALSFDYVRLGVPTEAERVCLRVLRFAEERDDLRLRALAKVSLAGALRLRGEIDAARGTLAEAEAILRDIDDKAALVTCLIEDAEVELLRNDQGASLLRSSEAEGMAAQHGLLPDRALALLISAEARLPADAAAAERAIREAEGLARELDQPEVRWRCEALAGEVALRKGDRSGAARRFAVGRDILDDLVEAIRDKDIAYSYMRDLRRVLLLRRSRENPLT